MTDEIDVSIDLTDPRAGHRPIPGTLGTELGETKAAAIEASAKEAYLERLRSSEDAARRVLEDRLDSARPRKERFVEQLDRALEAEREAYEREWQSKSKWLTQRVRKAESELPNLGGTDDG